MDDMHQIYQQHAQTVYKFLLAQCQNADLAEDLTQEVFLKLWRGLSGFRGQSHLLTWLSRIARNACADHIRKKKRTVPTESLSLTADDGDKIVVTAKEISLLNTFSPSPLIQAAKAASRVL